jgi:hypothetical protein
MHAVITGGRDLLRKSYVIVALALAAAFALWLYYLGKHLFIEVDARLLHHTASLPSMGVVITNFAACTLVPILMLCAFFLREDAGRDCDSRLTGVFLNLLGIIVGSSIGWGLGVFLVPFDDADGAIYSKIGAGATTFLSGFVVGYVPGVVKEQLRVRPKAFLVQLGLGAGALLVTGLAVTTNRTDYLEYARLMRADEAAVEAREKAEIEAVKARFAAEYAWIRSQRLAKQLENSDKVQAYIDQKHP